MMEAPRACYVPKRAGVALITWLVWLCSLTASLRDTFFFLGKVREWWCIDVDIFPLFLARLLWYWSVNWKNE